MSPCSCTCFFDTSNDINWGLFSSGCISETIQNKSLLGNTVLSLWMWEKNNSPYFPKNWLLRNRFCHQDRLVTSFAEEFFSSQFRGQCLFRTFTGIPGTSFHRDQWQFSKKILPSYSFAWRTSIPCVAWTQQYYIPKHLSKHQTIQSKTEQFHSHDTEQKGSLFGHK